MQFVSTTIPDPMTMAMFLYPFQVFSDEWIEQVQVMRKESLILGKETRQCFVLEGTMKKPTILDPNNWPEKFVVGVDFYLGMLSFCGMLKPEYADLYSVDDADTGKKSQATRFVLWIDAENNTLLKSNQIATVYKHDAPLGGRTEKYRSGLVEVSLTDAFSVAKVNTELPDELFKFTAPAGAKEIPNVRSRNKK